MIKENFENESMAKLFDGLSEADKKRGDSTFNEIMTYPSSLVMYLLHKFKEVGISPAAAGPSPAASTEDAPKEAKVSSYKLKIVSIGNKVKAIPILKNLLADPNVQISVLAGLLKEGTVIDQKTFSAQEIEEWTAKFASADTQVAAEEVK